MTAPATVLLPDWVTCLRAPNPGPMTLEGTNTYLLDDGTVIDPGPDEDRHFEAILAAGPVRRILATHGHHDHVGLLDRLARRTGAAVGELPVGMTLLKTPGHTGDSVCFVAARNGQRVVFTGDTVPGRGSTVVAWPDGDVGAYLESMTTLSAYEGVPALPGHGPAVADCATAARWLTAHRHERLDQVRQALTQGARTVDEVLEVVYPDVDPSIRFAADWSVRAQLTYLETLGTT